MRAKAIVFLFGLTVGMWADALLVQMDDITIPWRLLSTPAMEFNHDVINEALEPPVLEAEEEERPDANWLNVATPKWRPA